MSLAFLCPGQASQKVGMGHDIFIGSDVSKKYFEIANEVMGANFTNIIFNGPEEKLKKTVYTQPAIYTVSVIIGKLLIDKNIIPAYAAGHSLGEFSALSIAGAFDFKSGLELVKARAEGMHSAGMIKKGSMAAVIGLDSKEVERICNYFNAGVITVANYNAQGQVVISGEINAVKSIMPKMKDAGAARVVGLNVSGAFHSPLMAPAKEILTEKLSKIAVKDTNFPVYANFSALPISKSSDVKNAIVNQLQSPVYWQKLIENMMLDGVKSAIEVGPGKVLQGLSKRINKSLNMFGADSLEEIVNLNHV